MSIPTMLSPTRFGNADAALLQQTRADRAAEAKERRETTIREGIPTLRLLRAQEAEQLEADQARFERENSDYQAKKEAYDAKGPLGRVFSRKPTPPAPAEGWVDYADFVSLQGDAQVYELTQLGLIEQKDGQYFSNRDPRTGFLYQQLLRLSDAGHKALEDAGFGK